MISWRNEIKFYRQGESEGSEKRLNELAKYVLLRISDIFVCLSGILKGLMRCDELNQVPNMPNNVARAFVSSSSPNIAA